jgi:hypothetical protein
LPVDQLPRSELKTIAEGIRDRYYRPVMQAQQRAREDDERKQHKTRGRTRLIAAGTAHASRALLQQQPLDGLTRLELEQNLKRALEQDLDGSESEAEVYARVSRMLASTSCVPAPSISWTPFRSTCVAIVTPSGRTPSVRLQAERVPEAIRVGCVGVGPVASSPHLLGKRGSRHLSRPG